MTILRTELFGGSLIGVYLNVTNSYCFYPSNLLKSDLIKLKDIFNVNFFPTTINNSRLIGVYTAVNSHGIILPDIIRDDELDKIKINLQNFDDPPMIKTIKSIDNAFGNLILCNNNGAIISSLLKDYRKTIQDSLNVETVVFDFAGSYLPGSVAITNNKGCLVHPLSTDEEIKYISDILKVETDVSTINRGIPYLGSGAVVNDKDGVFGKLSTGPELQRLTSILQI